MHLGSLGFGEEDEDNEDKDGELNEENVDDEEDDNLDKEPEEKEEDKKKGPVWKKPQQKKKAKKPGKQGSKPKQKPKTKADAPATPTADQKEGPADSGSESDGDESDERSDESSSERGDKTANEKTANSGDNSGDEEEEWARFQKGMNRREKAIHGKSRISHSVHCPYYTDDKQEFWWVYISDRKTHSLITPPYHLTSLVTEEEVELKFTAPNKEGVYNFTVCVRSDSYLGVDLLEDIKLDVQKAWEAPKEHKQWDFTDDEEDDENKKDDSEESEYAEDSEFEEDSD